MAKIDTTEEAIGFVNLELWNSLKECNSIVFKDVHYVKNGICGSLELFSLPLINKRMRLIFILHISMYLRPKPTSWNWDDPRHESLLNSLYLAK